MADAKRLLAMDESNATCNQRFASAGIAQTVEMWRAYPELLLGTPGLAECISGVILYDESIRQTAANGRPFAQLARDAGLACAAQNMTDEVAQATLQTLRRVVPAAVPGIAFLSGGQSGELASERLNSLHQHAATPWPLPFSFTPAIQHPALEIWAGQAANRASAQAALRHRAHCNRAALKGEYTPAREAR